MTEDYADLDGIRFPSFAESGWVCQSITDWLTVPKPKTEPESMQSAHGSFTPGTLWREGSVHTLTLACIEGTVGDLESMVRTLNGLAGIEGTIPLKVSRDGMITRRDVWIETIIPPDHHLRPALQGIELDVRSDSPFAFGPTVVSSCGLPTAVAGLADPIVAPLQVDGEDGDPGRVSFTNSGTAPAPILMSVTGGMSEGVRLRRVESGDTVQLNFPILDGQTVFFDSAAHRATLNNQSDMTGYLTVDDWFDAPPQATTTVQFEALGDIVGNPRLTLSAAPAWY